MASNEIFKHMEKTFDIELILCYAFMPLHFVITKKKPYHEKGNLL